MPMTEDELRIALDNEEPQYAALAARLDASDVPRLRKLATGDDMARATKAVYLASLVEQDEAHDIVVEAARSPKELMRIASATALPNLPIAKREIAADTLIDEANPAVAKLVLRAVDVRSTRLAPKIRALEARSPHAELKTLARETLRDIDQPR
jgi:hypothetical protein